MKKFLIQFVLLIMVIGGALVFYRGLVPALPFLPEKTKVSELIFNDAKFKVEIADTSSKRSKGLSGREKLASDEGMLFVFDRPDKYSFWMKGLKFPLDFIWIKDDLVVDILPNIPPPSVGQTDEALPIYQPRVEINKVLEINGGVAEKLDLKIGDKVNLTP